MKFYSILNSSMCDVSAPTDVTVGMADKFWYPNDSKSFVTVLKLTLTDPCDRTLVTEIAKV